MILWSKTKAEITEPKTVALTKPERTTPLPKSNKDRVDGFRQMMRRRWAEANPILYAGLLTCHAHGKRKRLAKVQDVFYRTINWGRFSRFLKHADKQSVLKRLIRFTSVKVPSVAPYLTRRKKNREIKIKRPCVACGAPAQVIHHIIMIINGGPNIRRNTVPLCHACHAEVHPWLKEQI